MTKLINGGFFRKQEESLMKTCFNTGNSEVIIDIKNRVSRLLQAVLPDEHILVEVAFNEAINNAISVSEAVEVEITKDEKYVKLIVKDNGKGFDVESSLQEIEVKGEKLMDEILWSESGRGLYLMKKVMDKVEYNKKGNQVTLFKQIGGSKREYEH
ncbi:anti-sigma regulatory factor (Ser/Thr protein kinase) [Bacillus mesophilus]|uniref:ATP-binding protein n=1 Tax=Bacillus mesophilus TaxID=1808955 RepID=A0A6M0QDC7_9BACI|nr:ATP-binding protein [Bacillus mesophilus]MBM7660136.1 anti-sigma regulatory factor (Ser/Thr protein kinase) [Bacillus mesophilus]NEY73789.1 ATP-binding protein [Bacillus mesophilus]